MDDPTTNISTCSRLTSSYLERKIIYVFKIFYTIVLIMRTDSTQFESSKVDFFQKSHKKDVNNKNNIEMCIRAPSIIAQIRLEFYTQFSLTIISIHYYFLF